MAALSFLTLIQDESADELIKELQNEIADKSKSSNSQSKNSRTKDLTSSGAVHLVVVACEGKSKNAIDEAHNMIKSAILLSISKIKVQWLSKNPKNQSCRTSKIYFLIQQIQIILKL